MRTVTTIWMLFITILGMAQVPIAGGWFYVEHVDPMTDEDKSFIAVKSTGGDVYLAVSRYEHPDRDKFKVVVLLDTVVFGDRSNKIQVMYRVDSKPPTDIMQWNAASNNKGVTAPMTLSKRFVEELKGSNRLVIRVTPLSTRGTTVTHTFDTGGFEQTLVILKP